jgi:hypothetical protein
VRHRTLRIVSSINSPRVMWKGPSAVKMVCVAYSNSSNSWGWTLLSQNYASASARSMSALKQWNLSLGSRSLLIMVFTYFFNSSWLHRLIGTRSSAGSGMIAKPLVVNLALVTSWSFTKRTPCTDSSQSQFLDSAMS